MQSLPVIAGLESVERYWDARSRTHAAKLRPGEYYVTPHGEDLVTVTGSTLAIYLVDTRHGVSGMTHFTLPVVGPGGAPVETEAFRLLEYGRHALDLLIHAVIHQGGHRAHLQAALVGGANLWSHEPNAAATVAFARRYLAECEIPITTEAVGQSLPRKVWAHGDTPVVTQLDTFTETIRWREDTYLDDLTRNGWCVASDPTHTFSEHLMLLRHLDFIEACVSRASAHPASWTFGLRDALDVLGDMLTEHFGREETELYEDVAAQAPTLAPKVAQWRAQHRSFAARLAQLQALLEAPLGYRAVEVIQSVLSFTEDLRAHEREEGDHLLRAYTEDLGG